MDDHKTQRTLQGFALISTVLGTFFFFTPALDPFNLPKAALLVGGGVSVLFMLPTLRAKVLAGRLVSTMPLVLLFIAMLISGLMGDASIHRLIVGNYSRATGLMSYTAMILIALGLVLSTRISSLFFIYWALGSVALVEVGYGFLQWVGADPIPWENPYNPIIGTLGNPNFMSSTLAISSLGMVGLALSNRMNRGIRILSAGIALFGIVIAWLSHSIQGPIAFTGGLVFLLGVYIWNRKGKSPIFIAFTGISAVGVLILVLGVAKIGPLGGVLYRYTLGIRSHYWGAAWKMMLEHPWTGVGVDSFGESYRLARELTFVQSGGPNLFTNAAHSVPLQLGATLGFPAFILYLALQAFVVYRAVIALRRHPSYRIEISGLFAAWLAFQAQSLISIDQLGLAVWGWALSGVIIGLSHREESVVEPKRIRRRNQGKNNSRVGYTAVLGTTGIVTGIIMGWQFMLPDQAMYAAVSLPVSKDNAQSVAVKTKALVSASEKNQADPTYLTQGINQLFNIGANNEAFALVDKAVELYPNSFDIQQLGAAVYEQTNRLNEAINARKRIASIDPFNWFNWLPLGKDLALAGKKVDAISAYNKVVEYAPTSAEATTARSALTKLG